MKSSGSSSPLSYVGHVKNGVIVLDGLADLKDGQAVRVEPLASDVARPTRSVPIEFVKLRQLFAEWTDEDGKLSEGEADRLEAALGQHRGLGFRPAKLD